MRDRLYSVEYGTNAQTIAKMLRVLFPDAETVLDMTYGSGKFWADNTPWRVTGIDLDRERARDVCADFTRLPFGDSAFDVAILDPPYLTEASKNGTSRMDAHFSTYESMDGLLQAVRRGAAEAWRVGRIGTIVKVQNYSHSGLSVRMTRWVEDVIHEAPYGEVHRANAAKMVPQSWAHQLSVWSIHTTFLAFRHGSQQHARRAPLLTQDAVTVSEPEQVAMFGDAV